MTYAMKYTSIPFNLTLGPEKSDDFNRLLSEIKSEQKRGIDRMTRDLYGDYESVDSLVKGEKMNIFQQIGNFFHAAEQDVVKMIDKFHSPEMQQKVQAALNDIQLILPVAMSIAQEIDAIAPSKTTDELVALATKFNATFTPEIETDKVMLGQFLEGIALRELQKKFPQVTSSKLNAGLNLIVSLLHV